MMKKIITLYLFVFAILLGGQTMYSQNKKEINAVAFDKAKEYAQSLKLNKDQQEEVYQAYKTFQKSYVTISKSLEENQEQLTKINTILDERLESIMNDEQYKRYLELYRTY